MFRNIIDYRNINKKHRLTEEVVTVLKQSIPEALRWLPEILSEKNQSCKSGAYNFSRNKLRCLWVLFTKIMCKIIF